MKLSTRLLLPLLAAVAIVMSAFAVWAVRQRVTTLTEQSRREANAYAVALGLAIEAAFRDPTPKDIQEIIDRISRERTIYGVLVYGPDAQALYVSDPLGAASTAPPDSVSRVMAEGEPISVLRELDGQDVYSVIHPIRDPLGRMVGAFEVAQPLAFLQAQIRATRQRFVLNTVTLLIAVTFLILILVRQLVARPLGQFVSGAQALGRGELEHRIGPGGGKELSELADEFNRMAARLESARLDLLREGEERLDLERRLRETEKLAALGNLAAGLAHEIAAPLHVIRGRAEMLMRRPETVETERHNLRIIVEQIGRITVIVRNLLDFARRREPRLVRTDVGDVIGNVLEFLDWEIGRAGVTVEWEGPRSIDVHGDADLLNQVFMNLFVNALQALEHAQPESGPRIRIRTHSASPDAEDAAAVAIEVEDNGPGIPAQVMTRIFDPFVTSRTSGGGTGLGLAVARNIIHEHGGTLDACNIDGGGARFRISLPAQTTEVHAHA